MSDIHVSLPVNAPLDRLFAICADIPAIVQVIPHIERIEVLQRAPSGGMGAGFKWKETRRGMGKSVAVEFTVTEFSPPNSMAMSCTMMGIDMEFLYAFTSTGPSTCTVDLRGVLKPSGMASQVMAKMMSVPMAKGLKSDMDLIKKAAEARAAQ